MRKEDDETQVEEERGCETQIEGRGWRDTGRGKRMNLDRGKRMTRQR